MFGWEGAGQKVPEGGTVRGLPTEPAQFQVYPKLGSAQGEHWSEGKWLWGISQRTDPSSSCRQRGGCGKKQSSASNPNPFLCYFTAWYQGRIFGKTRQNSEGKENSYLLLPPCDHTQKLKTMWSWNCSTCISLQRGTICVLSNNKTQLWTRASQKLWKFFFPKKF